MLGKNVNFMKQNDLKILQKIKEKLFSQNCFSYEHIFSNSSLYSLSSAQIDYYGS